MKKEYSKPVAVVEMVPLYMMSGSDTSANLGISEDEAPMKAW